MTVDEELSFLDAQLRRLKIEYEIYFSNPSKKAPSDIEWKVSSLIKKFSEGGRLNFAQRFRYNEMAQRYAMYSDLWRKKGRIREEGYRRPQDAILSVQGVRTEPHAPQQHHQAFGVGGGAAAAPAQAQAEEPLRIECSDARSEKDRVQKLYEALSEAKKKAGEQVTGNLDSFSSFVEKKTSQIRKQYGCQSVEYTVEVQDGQVKLKAKAKT